MAVRASLALVGPFDVDDFGVQVAWRVTAAELARRRPDLTIRSFAPFGSTRPIAVAADVAVEPLVPPTAARATALRHELTASVRVGADLPREDLHARYVAHPEPSARDLDDAAAVLADPRLGVPTADLPREPDAAHLAARHWPEATCAQRRQFLRAMHWWPHDGPAVVVQGRVADIALAEELAAALPDGSVVALEADARDEAFSAALVSQLGPRASRVPAARSSIADRIAAIAGATLVVASDPAVLAVACSFGRPHRTLRAYLDGDRAHGSAEPDVDMTSARDALDAVYDDLAALDGGEPRAVTASDEVLALRAALTELEARLAQERVVLADYVRAVRNVTRDEVQALRDELQRRLTTRILRRVRRERRRA